MVVVLLKALIVLIEVFLAGLVLLKNPRSWMHRYLALSIGGVVLWTASSFLSDQNTSNPLIWNRLVFIGPELIALSFWLLAQELINKQHRLGIRISVGAASAALVLTSFTSAIVADVKPRFDELSQFHGYDLIHGPLYFLFIGYFLALMGWSFVLIYKYYKSARGLSKIQILLILTGTVLATLWGLVTNVLLSLASGSSAYAQYGAVSGLIFVSFLSYAIIRHRFLDIKLIIARSVAYIILLATLAALYGTAIFSFTTVFVATDSSAAHNLVSTALAVILAFTFQPLRRFFERITDRIFYRYRYDSQQVLNNFSKVLVSELNIERLLKKSLTELCESLHIQFGQVIIYNHDRVYRIEHYGPLPRRLMIAPELAKLGHPMLITDELEDGERKALLEGHGVRVSLMLRTREEFVGYLLLGDKLSGDIYSEQDVELLEIISKELAVTILNAKAYAEIQDFNINLQARIERATKRLRVANRHLKELDHAKDEFISMASHQLRTPLTTIKGYLSMMLEGDAGKLTPAQKDFVSYAFGSSERMVNLISDLLNVSRLQAGRFLIQARPTDMVRMIRDEVRQLETHARAKGIGLTFQLPDEPLPPVEIDENKTRQVIMNFIDNAIYYTQKGGVTVLLQQAGTRVRFEVRDTGIGVPQVAKKRLFSKFYRAENAQTIRPDGTGLGLYLAKRVVEDQGGTIVFESIEGEGSTFGFELPVHPEPPITKSYSKSKTPRKHADTSTK